MIREFVQWVLAVAGARGNVIVAATMLLAFAYVAYETQAWSTRSRTFALVLVVPALALGAVQLARELRRDPARMPPPPPEALVRRDALAWFAAFFASVWLLGLLASIVLVTVAYLRLAAREPWPRVALYAVAVLAGVYLLFDQTLHIRLPAGLLPPLLGTL